MTTIPEPAPEPTMPGEDPGVAPDEQQPDVTPVEPEPGPAADPGDIPATEPVLP